MARESAATAIRAMTSTTRSFSRPSGSGMFMVLSTVGLSLETERFFICYNTEMSMNRPSTASSTPSVATNASTPLRHAL